VTPVALPGGRFGYVIEAGPLRLAHLGGLRAPLPPERVKALGAVDVLMIPAGGGGLTPRQAAETARAVAARVVIPMAYRAPGMEGDAAEALPEVGEFVSATPWARVSKDSDVILVSKEELPPATEIWTLRYRR
jgi:L-ascorbate metabolism protein UlaG (beta-lactamase superfamily)